MTERETRLADSSAQAGVEAAPAAALAAEASAATPADGDAQTAAEPFFDLTLDEREALNKRDRDRLLKQQTERDDARGFYASEWRGIRRWQCQACPYDSFDLDAIAAHVERVHRPAPAPATVTVRRLPLYDRYGNQMSVAETTD